jgi:hypothetical protein
MGRGRVAIMHRSLMTLVMPWIHGRGGMRRIVRVHVTMRLIWRVSAGLRVGWAGRGDIWIYRDIRVRLEGLIGMIIGIAQRY